MTFNAQEIQIFAKEKNTILKSKSVADFKIVFFFLANIWITWALNVIRIPSQEQSMDSNKN